VDPASQDRCTRPQEARDPPAHQDPMDSREAQDSPETTASQANQASPAHQEMLEVLDPQETRVVPVNPEEMVRPEARVAATTAHHLALPQDTERKELLAIVSQIEMIAAQLTIVFSLTTTKSLPNRTSCSLPVCR